METIVEKKKKILIDEKLHAPQLLVGDIIKYTKWIPGKAYFRSEKPALTVFFPTFSRAKSGLFQKSLESILAQTIKNIEIIIIDDASTDGTHELILEYMQKDERISLLHHPFNVGFPAISCYEAFLKARADFFVFGFDDNYYYSKGYETLYEVAIKNPNALWFGNVMLHAANGEQILYGRNEYDLSLVSQNYIPNGGVILSRKMIEIIGFLDPHISSVRICDWTYWLKASNFFELKHIDTLISDEYGPSTNDSLAHVYSLDFFVNRDRASQYLYQKLDIKTYENIDVFSYREFKTADNQIKVIDKAYEHLYSRDFLKRISQFTQREYKVEQSKKIIVLKRSITACETLCFSYLPNHLCHHQIILTNDLLLSDLIKADIVILSRDIDNFKEELEVCMKLDIPIYYFTDDNLVELKKEFPNLSDNYQKVNFRKQLEKFKGCILTSPPLVTYFREQLLHDNLYYFPPSYAANPLIKTTRKSKKEYDLTVLILSGPHRHQDLIENIFPAINQLCKNKINIHLIVGNIHSDVLTHAFDNVKNIKLTTFNLEKDWKQLLVKTSLYCPDVIIHPYSDYSDNQIYKTHNIALAANLLDVVLIAPNVVPFANEEFKGASLIIEEQNNPFLYLNALNQVLENPDLCQQTKQNNFLFCKNTLGGKDNIAVLDKIAMDSPHLTPDKLIKRQETLITYLRQNMTFEQPQPVIFNHPAKQQTIFTGSVLHSLLELSHSRTLINKFQKLRFFWKRPASLWLLLEGKFPKLMALESFRNLNSAGYVLERSSPLVLGKVYDIPLSINSFGIETIACAFLTEGIFEGQLNIELLCPKSKRILEKEFSIIETDIFHEFLIDVKNQIDSLGTWHLKITVHSDYPIYLLQFNRYTMFNLKRKLKGYFIGLI